MAGKKVKSQITAAAPATSLGANPMPTESDATGDNSSVSPSPSLMRSDVMAQGRGKIGNALASLGDKGKDSRAGLAAPEAAPDTSAKTQAEFEAAVRELEDDDAQDVRDGSAGRGLGTAAPLKGAGNRSKANIQSTERDPIQDELDAEAEKESNPNQPEADDEDADGVEVPDAEADKDAFDSWIRSLSKPAAKKIEQQRKTIGKLKAVAAERIVLPPSPGAPLTHVHNLQQLQHEHRYWSGVRDLAHKGVPMRITAVNGKQLHLDPRRPQDARVIERYRKWANAALGAMPRVQDRLQDRMQSRPWEKAEKLAPGVVTDPGSFANQKAMQMLKATPQLARQHDYEVPLAHMVRSMQMEEDGRPTATHPFGKRKWVCVPLDEDGHAVVPKKAGSGRDPGDQAPKANGSKPMAVSRRSDVNVHEATRRAQEEPGEDSFRALVAAEERAARGA